MELTSVIAGAVLVLALKRVTDVPGEIRRNDDRVRNRDENLATWVADDNKQLGIELRRVQNEMAARGQLYSGARINARQHVRDRTIHRYRDQVRDAERVAREVRLSERWTHRALRALIRRPLPELTTPERAGLIVAEWQMREPLADDVGNAA